MTPMTGDAGTEGSATVRGYRRAEVDAFFARAQARRLHLQGVIEEASARREQHRALTTVLRDGAPDLRKIRTDAERRAAWIVAAADARADAIIASARADTALELDLTEAALGSLDLDGLLRPSASALGPVGRDARDDADPSAYFEYLRGALESHEPLARGAE